MRYFMFLSYKGTSYHGWQVQPGAVTVQKVLEECLTTIVGTKTQLTGAGRTDTGVHARYYCAHFDSSIENLHDNPKLIVRINKFLPPDIAVSSIKRVKPDAHARFDAIARTYRYYITRVKDPFMESSGWYIYGDLDTELMNKACSILTEYTDFTSFARLHSDVKTNNCRIFHASWEEDGHKLILTIKADRFLRNMVRAITGTMADIGKGRVTLDGFREIIEARDRSRAGKSAPAAGLFLEQVEYPEDIFL